MPVTLDLLSPAPATGGAALPSGPATTTSVDAGMSFGRALADARRPMPQPDTAGSGDGHAQETKAEAAPSVAVQPAGRTDREAGAKAAADPAVDAVEETEPVEAPLAGASTDAGEPVDDDTAGKDDLLSGSPDTAGDPRTRAAAEALVELGLIPPPPQQQPAIAEAPAAAIAAAITAGESGSDPLVRRALPTLTRMASAVPVTAGSLPGRGPDAPAADEGSAAASVTGEASPQSAAAPTRHAHMAAAEGLRVPAAVAVPEAPVAGDARAATAGAAAGAALPTGAAASMPDVQASGGTEPETAAVSMLGMPAAATAPSAAAAPTSAVTAPATTPASTPSAGAVEVLSVAAASICADSPAAATDIAGPLPGAADPQDTGAAPIITVSPAAMRRSAPAGDPSASQATASGIAAQALAAAGASVQAAPVAAGLAEVLAAEAAPVDAGQSPSISGMPSVTTTPVAADAGLNPAGVRGATASDAQAVPAPQAPLPVANPRAWAPLLGQHLMHLVQTGDTQATVRVNPPQLGPVELRLELKDSLTHVSFYAHDAQVREALEQSLPRLRELLGAQGLQLGQSHVGDQASQQQQQQPNPDGGSMAGSGDRRGNGRNDGMSGRDEAAVVSGAEVVLPVRKLLGGVDHYV